MNTNEKPHAGEVISDRENSAYTASCPIFIKRILLSRTGDGVRLYLTESVCGSFNVASYTVEVTYKNLRREVLGKDTAQFPSDGGALSPFADAVYADVTVLHVKLDRGEWDAEGKTPQKLPEQNILWQTDPLYSAMKYVCEGVTDAKYEPDTVSGAWRCTCGGLNLDSSEKCSSCSASREWLRKNFDREYLTSVKAELDSKKETDEVRKKKKADRALGDKAKAVLILSSAVLFIALVLLSVFYIVPSVRLSHADKLSASEEYDRAIEIYRDLGSFGDAEARLGETIYKKAQKLTGLDEVKLLYSSEAPWFEISEDGTLSFFKDRYTGSWYTVEIPDIFDGIIVRSLGESFFINCKELYSVTLSECIESVGEQAFRSCESLTSVKLPSSLKEIGARAFFGCTSLSEIEIPDSVTYLGLRAFNNCTSLETVILGKGVTKIESYLFSMCPSLRKVSFSSPITSVGEFAFSDSTNLKKYFCRFDESDWIEPEVAEGNEIFTSAERIYN